MSQIDGGKSRWGLERRRSARGRVARQGKKVTRRAHALQVDGCVSLAAARGRRTQNVHQSPEPCCWLAVHYGQTPLIPESVMSDPRATGHLRRLNHQGTFARTTANATVANTAARNHTAVPMWTILWTWLAAVAAVVVILGVVFGYGRSDL